MINSYNSYILLRYIDAFNMCRPKVDSLLWPRHLRNITHVVINHVGLLTLIYRIRSLPIPLNKSSAIAVSSLLSRYLEKTKNSI